MSWLIARYAFRVAPLHAVALALLALVCALLPPLFVLAGGALVDAVATGAPVAVPLALLAGSHVANQLLTPARQALSINLGRRVGEAVRIAVQDEASRPVGVAHLLDPEFRDGLGRAGAAASAYFTPLAAVRGLADVLPARLSALLSAAVLATYLWWAPVLLLAAWFGYRQVLRRQVATSVRRREEGDDSPLLARADYVRGLVLHPRRAAELVLAGARPWLVGRFTDTWSDGTAAVRERRAGELRAQVLAGGALVAAIALVLGATAAAAVDGRLTAAGLLVVVLAVLALEDWGWVGPEYLVEFGAPHLVPVLRLPALRAAAPDVVDGDRPVPAGAARLTARGLRFAYRERAVLDGLDLDVPAGSTVAIVGRNGAGKSTLARLLVGALDPDGGTVAVNGVPLPAHRRADWLARCAVLDQDTSRYPATLLANVAGAAADLTGPDPTADRAAADRAADRVDAERALRDAGAGALLTELPDGLDTLLTTPGLGGTDLSGGQWQRVLLARVLFQARRGAALIVLDEPTAHLDVRAEAAFNGDFTRLTRGVTTVLISHRLSTVRHADRILVLADGRIAEHGTHGELLAADTAYARLFRLQARSVDGLDGEPAGAAALAGAGSAGSADSADSAVDGSITREAVAADA